MDGSPWNDGELPTEGSSVRMQSIRPIRRKRGPSIEWTPASDSYFVVAGMMRSTAHTPPLLLTQAAILDLEARIAADPSPAPFGLLVGALCLIPRTEEKYLLVDEVIPASKLLTSSDPLAELADELRGLAEAAEKRRRLVHGWYLGGMDDDLRLDPDALSLHQTLFPEARHVLLLRNAPGREERGGIFRYERMTETFYSIPFFELVAESGKTGEARRSAIRWSNYRAAEPVRPVDAPAQEASAARLLSPKRGDTLANGWWQALRRTRERTLTERSQRTAPAPVTGVRAAATPVAIQGVPRPDPEPVTVVPIMPSAVQVEPESPPATVRVTFPALLTDDAREDPPAHPRSRLLIGLCAMLLLILLLLVWVTYG